MLKRLVPLFASLLLITACQANDAPVAATAQWEAGKNYFLVEPAQPTSTGDKVEVLEIFSYACPHCAHFQPYADQIKAALPAKAQFVYMPAIFNPSWAVYARAFYTAKALGVLDKSHQALFDALHRDHKPLTTIEELAGFYAEYGVKSENFLSTAKSFVVEGEMARSLAMVPKYGVDGTPSIIVNGKYRVSAGSAGGFTQTVELVDWLVKKEIAAKAGK